MEPKEKWSSHERATFWLEFVGVLGVIGALLFSGVQLKTSNDALELTNEQLELTNDQLFGAKYESVYGHQLDLWQLAVDHKGAMAPYVVGREIPPPEGDPERARVDAASANALDFYAHVFQQLAPWKEDGGLPPQVLTVRPDDPTPPGVDPEIWEAWWSWTATILAGFDDAPGMCENLTYEVPGSGFVYDRQFIAAVQEAGRCL
jgi:hypothetical protein